MIRTAIIDDEPLAVELLADYVQKTPGLVLVEASADVFGALQRVQNNEIDLVLLDIQMPALTGIQFLKIIGDRCKVVLTTAYTEYALESYDFNVADYLLKPISYERFVKAIRKITFPDPGRPARESPGYIFIKSEYRLLKINLEDILFVEALRDYIAVHTTDGKKIMSLDTLRNMQVLLPASQFSRIHKSYLVADSKITAIEKGNIVLNNLLLPIGSSYQKEVYEKLLNFKP
ncbi:two component transcriptional regulator, LytTR family [Niabella drilacis]|uniref:Two component transcriptional regulator, LytTR family n=2 Tax=Niabella drilacis (strain DSM 25811 / CCM 8410 / CCUG 62505 / LMG 26954 / E90) TaxID=1285928 RepID=A0A1G6N2P0_NIADE|nr:two component transcriptional regulator, LytTR family [Niabella drilacis]